MPLVSVIVSVYNTEKYIEQCLDSILAQTFRNYECIIVNDGSTDGSQSIIERFSKKDPRFKVVNKKNGGVSTARNAGLDMAIGDYIIFLDGDDFFEEQFIELMYDKARISNADIIAANFKNYFQNMNKFSDARIDFNLLKMKKGFTSYKVDPDNLLNILTLMFWNKLFKTDFLRQNNIRNDESLHRAQDIDAVGRALVSTEKIAIVDEVLIYYRTEAGGSNVGRLYKYPYDVLRALENVKSHLEKMSIYQDARKSYVKFSVDHILAALYVTEMYPVHKQIYQKSKTYMISLGVKDFDKDYFSDEKSHNEAKALVESSYEQWLQLRIADLRNDSESKYISYLLGEFQRKYAEEVDKNTALEHQRDKLRRLSLAWHVRRALVAGKSKVSKALHRD